MTARAHSALAGLVALLALGVAAPAIAQQTPKSGSAKPSTKARAETKSAPKAEKDSDKKDAPKTELATFGGGCFWCMEAVFERIKGVKSVVSGYSGGRVAKPSYALVCTGATGHAEVVQIEFDPEVVSYETLLEVFFHAHDPTLLNRQGPDEGTQYRSIILYHNEDQRKAALAAYKQLTEAGVFPDPIVTELVPFKVFYPADKHHQDYFRKNPYQPYCQANIVPKLQKLGLDLQPAPGQTKARKGR